MGGVQSEAGASRQPQEIVEGKIRSACSARMNNVLTPYVDAAPTASDLAGLSLSLLKQIRSAAHRVERAAWAEEGRRVARGIEPELRWTRDRERLPAAMRARVIAGDLTFIKVRPRAVMQSRDWALQIRNACDVAIAARGAARK